jgi:hypothetical protein
MTLTRRRMLEMAGGVVLGARAACAAIGAIELASPLIAATAIAGSSLISVLQESGAVVVADVAG